MENSKGISTIKHDYHVFILIWSRNVQLSQRGFPIGNMDVKTERILEVKKIVSSKVFSYEKEKMV